MNENNILLLAVGDGAINIVEQNMEKLSEHFSVATIHKDVYFDSADAQWQSMLKLVVPQDVKYVCLLNCLGGDDDLTILSIMNACVSRDILVIGALVFPFSFEGSSRFQLADSKLSIMEKGIPQFDSVEFDETSTKYNSCHCIIKFFNDDMFIHFPNDLFYKALRHFNEEICDGIIAHMKELSYIIPFD